MFAPCCPNIVVAALRLPAGGAGMSRLLPSAAGRGGLPSSQGIKYLAAVCCFCPRNRPIRSERKPVQPKASAAAMDEVDQMAQMVEEDEEEEDED